MRGILADLPTVELVLLEPGTLPVTPSGSVSRAASRQAYLDGVFAVGGGT